MKDRKMKVILTKLLLLGTIAAWVIPSMVYAESVTAEEEFANPQSVQLSSGEKQELRTIGTASEKSKKITIINQTGEDISYINIYRYDPDYDETVEVKRMQEALIEQGYLDDVADGSFGPKTKAAVEAFRLDNDLEENGGADFEMLTLLYGEYDDGNLLKKEDVIHNGETVILGFLSEEAQQPERDTGQETLVYHATVKLVNEDNDYTLHILPEEESTEITLLLNENILYIEYVGAENQEVISTFDEEKAEYEREHAAANTNTYNTYYDDYYYDDSYYYDDYYYEYEYDDRWVDDGYYDDSSDTSYGQDGCIEDGLFW